MLNRIGAWARAELVWILLFFAACLYEQHVTIESLQSSVSALESRLAEVEAR
jgi:hypothetical protein